MKPMDQSTTDGAIEEGGGDNYCLLLLLNWVCDVMKRGGGKDVEKEEEKGEMAYIKTSDRWLDCKNDTA